MTDPRENDPRTRRGEPTSADPLATTATRGPEDIPSLGSGENSAVAAPDVRAIPGYEILGELGRGGMGVVYKARQISLGRRVALKMILSGEHAGEEERGRFRTEAEAAARLQHPHIVQIHEIGEHDGRPFFSLELVEGRSLARRLRGTPLPPTEAARLVAVLATAMHYAHQRGIVHRDLKPGNILLADEPAADGAESPLGFPKITDFGLAKKVDDPAGRTRSGAILGTPSYMAPEQARGQTRAAGPGVDIYALGAILYELLTGRPPFRAASVWDTIAQVLHDDPVPPRQLQPKVPRDLETICLKCLEKEPRRRYASAAALAEDLNRFLSHQPVRARPAGWLYRTRKFTQRNTVLVAGLSGVFCALVLGLIGTSLGLLEATRQAGRAWKAEGETRELLAQSYVQTADLAMRRGAWREALDNFAKAQEAGLPDSASVRLTQVKAWVALDDTAQALREIDELAQRTDLGEEAGPVLLAQADLRLTRSALSEDCAPFLAQIEQAVRQGLPPAEAAYAQGLLTPTLPEAMEQFRRAVELDPLHPRANSLLVATLTQLARFGEARQRLAVAELLFPDASEFKVMHALIEVLEGRLPAAHAVLEKNAAWFGAERLAAAHALMEGAFEARQWVEEVVADEGGNASFIARMLRAPALIAKLSAATKNGPALPLHPLLQRYFQRFGSLVDPKTLLSLVVRPGRNPRLMEAVSELVKIWPDGLFFFLRGTLVGSNEDWSAAEQDFLRAADTPSLSAALPQPALYFASQTSRILYQEGPPGSRSAARERARDHLRRLLARGEVRPAQREPTVITALAVEEYELARRVLTDWQRQVPDDQKMLYWLAILEFKTGGYGRAIAAADRILKRQPKDAAARKVREAAVEQLLRQANALKPARG